MTDQTRPDQLRSEQFYLASTIARVSPASVVTAAHARELVRHFLVGFSENRAKLARHLAALVGEEGDGDTLGTRTPRSADAVHVVLDVVGHVKVDDAAHVLDVETTGCHVGSNEDGGSSRAKLVHAGVSFLLRLVAVHGAAHESLSLILAHGPLQRVAAFFGFDKDEHALAVVEVLEVVQKTLPLVHVRHNLDDLMDGLVGLQIQRAHVHLVGVFLELAADGLHFFGPRGGPHERLAVRANLRNDGFDLRFKAHVEHAVGLVQNQVSDAPQVGGVALEVVNQAPRGGDDNLAAATQNIRLRALGHTTIDDCVLDLARCAKLVAFDLDLQGELASGRKDQHDGAVAGLQIGLKSEMEEDKRGEG